jgi:hypothetical protein
MLVYLKSGKEMAGTGGKREWGHKGLSLEAAIKIALKRHQFTNNKPEISQSRFTFSTVFKFNLEYYDNQ